MPSRPDATICITTRNRCGDLLRALRSAEAQSGPLIEILVIDDGSTDGTAEIVERDFPRVKLIRHSKSLGYIVRRNEAARLALAPIVFSIDDDAEFAGPDVVAQTLVEFECSHIGAVAIPFVNVMQSDQIMQQARDAETVYISDVYIGTAHALRCDVFLELGGYRERLIHQGEERDYCIRMLAAGYYVRLGRATPIHHYESQARSFHRMDYYGRRNDILFAWNNVPQSRFLFHLMGTIFNGLRAALRNPRNPWGMYRGIGAGIVGMFRYWNERKPVSIETYILNRHLRKRGPVPLQAIISL